MIFKRNIVLSLWRNFCQRGLKYRASYLISLERISRIQYISKLQQKIGLFILEYQ